MGYHIEFKGYAKFDRPIDKELRDYINKFSATRHMQYDSTKIKSIDKNWKSHGYQGKLGKECSYYVVPENINDQDIVKDNFNDSYNTPPADCPSLWCNWIINNKNHLVWNGSEKFEEYVHWLEYLIKHFFKPNNYILNGKYTYQGDFPIDRGTIIIKDNQIIVA